MKRLLALLVIAPACVSSGTYNRKVAELTQARLADQVTAKHAAQELESQLDVARKNYLALQDQLSDVQANLDRSTADKAALAKQVDDAGQLVSALEQRLKAVGQNVDSLVAEKGALAKQIADTSARLEAARKQEAAAEARAATFRNLVARLRSMIDAGQLKVEIRGGRMIIALPNDILFDSGRTDVKADGKAALAKVAQVLKAVGDRDFVVAGHTDDVPIRTEMFPSNWELSTRRAVEVVHYLVAQGMNPKVLSAAGYGEYDPVAANDTPEHRGLNRRIEIVLQPNLSDLPPMDADTTAVTTAATAAQAKTSSP
jgi:chemotaxis protein MotB